MNRRLASLAILCATLFAASVAAARADSASGTWSITTVNGSVRLHTTWNDGEHSENNSTRNIDPAELGITAALQSSGQQTKFTMHRDAGDFVFEGSVGNGQGGGTYTFTSNDTFFRTLRARGYTIKSVGEEMGFAHLDVSMAFVNAVEALGFKGDTNTLLGFRALNVTPDYVRALQRAGISGLSAGQIMGFRALNVDRPYIDDLASAGYPHLSAGDYLALKALKVDGAYIKYLRKHGLTNLTVKNIEAMKAEGI